MWCLCYLKKSYLILPCSFISLILYLNTILLVQIHQWGIGWVLFHTNALRCHQKYMPNALALALPREGSYWAWRASRSTQKEVNDFLPLRAFPLSRDYSCLWHPLVLLSWEYGNRCAAWSTGEQLELHSMSPFLLSHDLNRFALG